jgi:hypothetical protein
MAEASPGGRNRTADLVNPIHILRGGVDAGAILRNRPAHITAGLVGGPA